MGCRDIDEYEIPIEAIREALINAIVHRDYSVSNSDIKISIFDSFIQIISPGNFPRGLTLEEALSGSSEIRNKVLARIFKEAKFIEQWGTAIRRIIDKCELAGIKLPEIKEGAYSVSIKLFRQENVKPNEKSERMKRANERKKRTYENLINLVEKGIIEKIGAGKATKYILKL